MRLAKGLVLFKVHKFECPPDANLRKKCPCTRYLKWRLWPQGRTGPVENRSFGTYSPAVLDFAEKELKSRRDQIARGEQPSRGEVQIRFSKAMEIYEELYAKFKPSYRTTQGARVSILRFFGQKWFDLIKWEDVRDWRAARSADKKHLRKCPRDHSCRCKELIKPSTVNREHTILTHIFNQMRRWKATGEFKNKRHLLNGAEPKLPQENPSSLVPKVDERNLRRTKVLDLNQYEALMTKATPSLQIIIRAAVMTTLRKKDLVNLTKQNFDPNTDSLKGIQSKSGLPFDIPIDSKLKEYIRSHPAGKGLCDFTNFRSHWDRAREAAGLKDLQFRDLRRTGATWIYRKTNELDSVSAILGHASITMTERYIGLDNNRKAKAIASISDLFRAPEKLEP